MPNGSNLPIPVSLVDVGGTKKVQAPNTPVGKNTTPVLLWVPQSEDFEIYFIGFNDPVGPGKDISEPQQQGSTRNWFANDLNRTAKVWPYTIYAISAGVIYSSDPEIVNEGVGGMEDEEPGQGGGQG